MPRRYYLNLNIDLRQSENIVAYRKWLKFQYSQIIKNRDDLDDIIGTTILKSIECQDRNGIVAGHLVKITRDELANYYVAYSKRHVSIDHLMNKLSTQPDTSVDNRARITFLENMLNESEGSALSAEIAVQLLKLKQDGTIKHFPYAYFREDKNKKAKRILDYIQKEIWQCSDEELWSKKSSDYSDMGLSWVITKGFGSLINFLNELKPLGKPWLYSHRVHWSDPKTDIIAIRGVKSMAATLFSEEKINGYGEITKQHFRDFNLFGAYQSKFKNKKHIALLSCFCDLKITDIENSRYRWTLDPHQTRTEIISLLKSNGISLSELPERINKGIFLKTKFWSMVNHRFPDQFSLVSFILGGNISKEEYIRRRRAYVDSLGRKPFKKTFVQYYKKHK